MSQNPTECARCGQADTGDNSYKWYQPHRHGNHHGGGACPMTLTKARLNMGELVTAKKGQTQSTHRIAWHGLVGGATQLLLSLSISLFQPTAPMKILRGLELLQWFDVSDQVASQLCC